ncbi:hypothetical protein HMPREF9700_01789 [Bergeyella zoohelcum CCUG 30536]|uniref:Uncharacterized protein n=2 Tax=Bergeyella zoohelcum TaxID=1015 RepID=A0A380ZV59_9FLAO|nr:hypothetical protein HMPREF9700_01789 [Bergeyella zoohelcum CCUG 30536]SUV53207.1 Uncharacterised protein [Bergeyella zoohelcum]
MIFFLLIISCKEEIRSPYFTSDEIHNAVLESVEICKREISETDAIYYVMNRYDTLIIMSVKYENVIKPTFMVKKEGTFYYNYSKIIVTKPYKPIFEIIKHPNELKQNDFDENLSPYNGTDYQKGVMFKIKDINNLELITKGDLTKYFYSIDEYELPIIPPP